MPSTSNVQPLVDAALHALAQAPHPERVPLRSLVQQVSDKRVNFALWDVRTRHPQNLAAAVYRVECALGGPGTHHVNDYRFRLRGHSSNV
jgi:hypothetical protein